MRTVSLLGREAQTASNLQQKSLSSWIPENIKKKECVYFVESPKLSDAG